MKRGVVSLILFTVSLWTAPSRAEDSPPSLTRPEQLGRLLYFRGPGPVTRYAPLALSTSLTCEPSTLGINRTCLLQIHNQINGDDLALMSNLQVESPGLQFSPLSREELEEVHEDFQKMDRDLPTAGLRPPGSLAFSSEPYVSLKFTKSKRAVERIETKYRREGIGVFNIDFSFNGSRTEDYLEIQDSSRFREVLQSTGDGAKPLELRPRLEEAFRAGRLSTNNLTDAEAVSVAYRMVVGNFFRITREGLLYPRFERFDEILDSLVLVNETRSPVRGRCQASLPLKQGGIAQISCLEVEP